MNSPPEPGSPSLSTPSSGSPPPEEINAQASGSTSTHLMNTITSHLTSTFSGSSSKRRLPGGSGYGASSSNRDPKTRRRGDTGRGQGGDRSGGGSNWDNSKETGRREKDDLVDNGIVEFLRKEIGDPFQDSIIKKFA
ncbi:hypothetical protein BDZ94DRAFT_1244331 [Collybia nuda]|uniref:Uncharacterized protein n=1 Tax=Collybia nuda TaxID=64659 RepID=A0A9P6CR93_9AGAR|nr:hypothetical protein BDZ94DRAFT_1244331 [Collybia nuda]